MRLSIGDVWDRTTDVLRGRTGIIAPIAATAIFLPTVLFSALHHFGGKGTFGAALLLLGAAFVVVAATFWGTLAIIAIASDPATTRSDAQRQATRRLPAAIGIVLALAAILLLATIPLLMAMAKTGIDFSNPDAAAAVATANPSGGLAAFISFYAIAWTIVAFVLSARIFVLNPVILNERRGLASPLRSIELTRGMTWKLIGLLILFLVMWAVPSSAAKLVAGLAVRLVAGPDSIATVQFVSASASAVVTTAFSAVAAVFQAQLYVALRDRQV